MTVSTLIVRLAKFDNQAGEFKHYRDIKVLTDQLPRVVAAFSAQRCPVKGFYKYSWSIDGNTEELYCTTPAVFDNIEISQI